MRLNLDKACRDFQAQLIETDEVDEVDHVHLRLNYPGQTFRLFAAQQP